MRVVVERSLALEFLGGREVIEAEGGNLLQILRALDAMAPGLAEQATARFAFAVDGVLATDWSKPLPAGAEVLLFPRVGGG